MKTKSHIKNPPYDGKFPGRLILCMHFLESSLPLFGGYLMERDIFIFSERFVHPNAEHLGIFAVSTYKLG